MKERKNEGTDLITRRQTVTGVYGSAFISESDIQRLQRQTVDKQTETASSQEENRLQDHPTTPVWESRKAFALKTAGRPIRAVGKILKQIIIPEEYSVFIRKK